MYEVTFAKLSERFFKGTTWPPVEDIAELVDKDSVFCLLYKVSQLAKSCQTQCSESRPLLLGGLTTMPAMHEHDRQL